MIALTHDAIEAMTGRAKGERPWTFHDSFDVCRNDRLLLLQHSAALAARLAEAEAAITDARTNLGALSPSCFKAEQWIGEKAQATWVALDNYHFKHLRTADSATAVQPERCCLDYPRCDCNSPPEPDNAPTLQPCGHPWKAQHNFKCILCSSPGIAQEKANE